MEQKERSNRWILAGMVLVPALAVGLLMGGGFGGSTVAQDATPRAGRGAQAAVARPAHIHSGTCEEGELGEIVFPLTELTAPAGEAVGQRRRAVVAESSFTSVPAPLETILADPHAINVHLSAEEIGTYIACGEIGGAVDPATGAVAVGLRELNGSGFTGIAYLAPGADGASTDVSVFVAETQRAVGGRRAATPAAGGAGDADVTVDADADATPTS